MIRYVVSLLLGYCIGSFPSAYLLVKWKARIDIRESGTGNVGARNTLDVTGSKCLGLAVLVIDVLKGVLAVVVASQVVGREFWLGAAAGIGAVLGHNYSLWIGWKGGRGLATAAGALLPLGWMFIAAWCAFWFVTNWLTRNLHVANVVATIVSPFVVLLVPSEVVTTMSIVQTTRSDVFVVGIVLCSIILIRHIRPIVELWKSRYTTST